MHRIHSRYLPLFALACLFAPTLLDAAETPNFVIIYCDDLGYRDVGCFGAPDVRTPHIDKMAADGLRFTDFYSAYCVCSASRAALLTGCYQPRISMRGVLGPHSRTALHPDEVTIADMLKTRGYATCCVGKWHVGDSPETLPAAQGFDSYFGIPYSNDMARKQGWGNGPADLDKIWREKRWDIYNNELYRDTEIIESPVNQTTLTDRYTAESVKFIRANQGKPFFLYLAQTMVHVPLFVSDERYESDPAVAFRLTIEHIDDSVGQVLAALEETGAAENTLVVFTSDNGPWLSKKHHAGSALPLRAGKGTTYDGGMREPCVMRWPAGIAAGGTCRQVASTIDLLPTFAHLVGAELPADRPIDGFNIAALLKDPAAPSPHDEHGFCYYKNNKLEALRLGDWKLHLKAKPELYNLRDDIGEAKNVAADEPEVVRRLQKFAARYDADLKANTRPAWTAKGGDRG